MSFTSLIESFNLSGNIIELTEDTPISYLIHYAAPYTGDGVYTIKAGTRFVLGGPNREGYIFSC